MVRTTISREAVAARPERQANLGLPLSEPIFQKSIIISIPDSTSMMAFMKAFTTQLRENQHLDIQLGRLDSDPEGKYALIGSALVFRPPAVGRSAEELASVSLNQDMEKCVLFVKVDFESPLAAELIKPAISPALAAATLVESFTLPITIIDGASDLADLDRLPRAES
jgi:hypothetical protein